MTPTDPGPDDLSGALFDEVIAPLAHRRREDGSAPYFSTERDTAAASYFCPATGGVLSAIDFQFPGGGDVEGLVRALVTHWAAEGELTLSTTASRLQAIASELQKDAAGGDGTIDIFCYTLF